MPTLKREREISIPDFARHFVDGVNRERIRRGDLPLTEEQIQRIAEGLQDLRQRF